MQKVSSLFFHTSMHPQVLDIMVLCSGQLVRKHKALPRKTIKNNLHIKKSSKQKTFVDNNVRFKMKTFCVCKSGLSRVCENNLSTVN